jgi:hypothetical protein
MAFTTIACAGLVAYRRLALDRVRGAPNKKHHVVTLADVGDRRCPGGGEAPRKREPVQEGDRRGHVDRVHKCAVAAFETPTEHCLVERTFAHLRI